MHFSEENPSLHPPPPPQDPDLLLLQEIVFLQPSVFHKVMKAASVFPWVRFINKRRLPSVGSVPA